MSRRTAASNKAIRDAWKNEQNLVKEGKGTRDWTIDQQKDILERGKAYDENGKAFEGQHMRSAEVHPECQGDASKYFILLLYSPALLLLMEKNGLISTTFPLISFS